MKATQRYKQGIFAFYLAESGIDKVISKLPGDTSSESNVLITDNNGINKGEMSYVVTTLEAGKRWKVESWGYVPNQAQAVVSRHLEAFISKKPLPGSFWTNAIYTAGNVRLNGNAYTVNGDIIYAGNIIPADPQPPNFIGTDTQEPDVNPLVKLDYENLRLIAEAQIKADGSDNVYTAAEIAIGNPPLPDSFWFDDSDADPANWVPNVVYIETDLILNGNVGTIGGFLLVVGDVVTNPSGTSETTINGNGQIDGCIYSTGEFRVNGGGAGLNVFGGIWSGSDGVRMNGNVTVIYNQPYMDAIKTVINPGTVMQLISWREI